MSDRRPDDQAPLFPRRTLGDRGTVGRGDPTRDERAPEGAAHAASPAEQSTAGGAEPTEPSPRRDEPADRADRSVGRLA